jgi:ATP-binding cassette subfamily C protein CydC
VNTALWGLARPFWRRMLGAGLLGALADLAGVALMATATWLLITAAGRPPITALTVAIVAVRAFAIGRGGLRYVERLASHDAVLRVVTEVRARAFATLAREPAPRTGDALSRLISDVDAVQDLVVRVILPTGSALLVAVLAVGLTAIVSPVTALVLAAGLLVTGAALPLLAARLAERSASRLAPLRAELSIATVDLVHGAADLAAYGAHDRYAARTTTSAAHLAQVERGLARRAMAVDALATGAVAVTSAAVLLAALGDGVSGVLIGSLAVGTLAVGELTTGLIAAARRRAEITGALARITPLISGTPRVIPRSETAHGDGAQGGRELRAEDISVAGRLAPIDISVEPGSRIAVVGPSGSGKSTLLGVLAGHIAPTAGLVSYGGEPLPDDAYHLVGGLFADAAVFHASVEENVTLGRTATREELDDAARAAGLLEWIDAQPQGWATLVGEDGTALSGGQRQRLTLARALLQAPPVLLLDEPTEGLDPVQADDVLRSVFAQAGLRAVVVVTHRPAERDAPDFQRIIALNN